MSARANFSADAGDAAMTHAPSTSDVQGMLRDAYAAYSSGRFDAAAHACRRILTVDARCGPAHFLVGLISLERKDLKTAVSAFGSVTRLQDDHVAAWAQLARALLQVGQPDRAQPALRRALQIGSQDPIVQDLIGTVCSLFGDHNAAHEWFRRAAQFPVAAYQINLANNLVALGRGALAREALAAALNAEPGNPQAHWMLAHAGVATSTQHVRELERLCALHTQRPHALAFFEYAAGKEYEDLERWDDAYDAFERGAAAKRSLVAYDEAAEEAMFAAITETYSARWCARPMPGCDDASPIFVVGQPRTGTTLIERIITSHSHVHSAGELQQFGMAVRRAVDVPGSERHGAVVMRSAANIDTKALGEAYLRMAAHLRGGSARFVDKLPINFLYLGLIAKALPNARIVHVMRNPVDSCFANYKQLFADAYFHSYDQREMARHYLRYCRLMDHWRSALPGRFIDVAYEDVVDDLEREARRLVGYLGLPWEDACMNFQGNAAPVTTASAMQVREPVYRRSVARWRSYERHLGATIDVLHEGGLI
jgi:tetratricopeptide (TPR) repeat protein